MVQLDFCLFFYQATSLCPNPSLINGLIEGSPPHDVGSQVRFTCNEGHVLNGASSSFCVTTEDGATWQPQVPACEPGMFLLAI